MGVQKKFVNTCPNASGSQALAAVGEAVELLIAEAAGL